MNSESTRGISISIVRLLPIGFLLYLQNMGDSFPVRIMHIKGYLRTWCHCYFICAKSRWDRTGRWGRATVRLNSKRSWSPTHLSLSSWPPTVRRLLQCHTCTKVKSPLEACQWRCCLLRLGLEGTRTMQRSHADTLMYVLFLVVWSQPTPRRFYCEQLSCPISQNPPKS